MKYQRFKWWWPVRVARKFVKVKDTSLVVGKNKDGFILAMIATEKPTIYWAMDQTVDQLQQTISNLQSIVDQHETWGPK